MADAENTPDIVVGAFRGVPIVTYSSNYRPRSGAELADATIRALDRLTTTVHEAAPQVHGPAA
jgi:hypothetical protein